MIYIIAEIGVNHNGSFAIAKKMIGEAKKAGANAVKFQNFIPEEMTLKSTEKAKYQKKNTAIKETHYEMLEKYTLTEEEYVLLKKVAKSHGIDFISTPFDYKSLIFLLKKLKLSTIKISSTDIDNVPLLIKAGASNKNIIISSGMSTIDDVDIALSALAYGNKKFSKNFKLKQHKYFYKRNLQYLQKKVTLMHCTSEYPAPLDELNLNVLDSYKERYNINIGYSDHSCDALTPIIATSKGISSIEVHVTLNKKMSGPDHLSSLTFNDFRKYIKNIRKSEVILGNKKKVVTKSESKNIKVARKSLVVSKGISKHDKLSENNLTSKRPGSGISPRYYFEFINKKVNKNIKKDSILQKYFIQK